MDVSFFRFINLGLLNFKSNLRFLEENFEMKTPSSWRNDLLNIFANYFSSITSKPKVDVILKSCAQLLCKLPCHRSRRVNVGVGSVYKNWTESGQIE